MAASNSAVNQRHPSYGAYELDWRLMRDAFEGERVVKDRGFTYLSPTSGMEEDGVRVSTETDGFKAYAAYRRRAVFPDFVSESIEAALGVMHLKPPTIELPTALEPMLEVATLERENLEMLLQRLNFNQLRTGRVGLLLDVPDSVPGTPLPYIALYEDLTIINWDAGQRDDQGLDQLNLVVLDETEYEREGFSWTEIEKYRVLVLGDLEANEPEGTAVYRAAEVRYHTGENQDPDFVEPSIRGNTLERIPFVFVNSRDIVPEPDRPPLLGLGNLAMTVYRGEADYRQALHMQGQDTLVLIGGASDDSIRVGANAHLRMPIEGDAKYIGPDSSGLPEMREALSNDRGRASQKGGQLLDSTSRERESGEALRIRVSARTATLREIAITGAFALQEILRIAAEWVGANPEEVIVTPNLDFVDDTMDGKNLVELMTAKTLGAPMSLESVHARMSEKGLTEMAFEEEMALIEQEPSTGPGGLEDDDDDTDDTDDTGDE